MGDAVKIVKIEKQPPFNHLENDTRLKAFDITYKLKGNKHHYMTVFATEEVQAIAKAMQAYETNQGVIVLQKLARG